MTATIDAGGRVVIPKAIRVQLGLAPGASVELLVRDGVVVLAPKTASLRLVKRGGGWVADPEEPVPKLTADEVRATLEGVRR
ncbi:MAG: AbrB/MazE/SpoVT family DNA-binding domain-containing protein [Deltaproteobacteria bacterium]|nr:AbrB/MazE/SpoVT family DNA-binding domain-containing protein [Deltaproteobacteria bacterium]